MSSRSEKTTAFLTGVLFGGIIGSALAVLYTPYSGKKMRRVINNKTTGMVDDVPDYIETGKGKVEGIYKEGKKRAETIINDTKKILNN